MTMNLRGMGAFSFQGVQNFLFYYNLIHFNYMKTSEPIWFLLASEWRWKSMGPSLKKKKNPQKRKFKNFRASLKVFLSFSFQCIHFLIDWNNIFFLITELYPPVPFDPFRKPTSQLCSWAWICSLVFSSPLLEPNLFCLLYLSDSNCSFFQSREYLWCPFKACVDYANYTILYPGFKNVLLGTCFLSEAWNSFRKCLSGK